MIAPIDRIENVRAQVEDVQRQMEACQAAGVQFAPTFAWQLLSACKSLLGPALTEVKAEALDEAADELAGMGVEPWNRLTPAIQALQLRAARLREGGDQ